MTAAAKRHSTNNSRRRQSLGGCHLGLNALGAVVAAFVVLALAVMPAPVLAAPPSTPSSKTTSAVGATDPVPLPGATSSRLRLQGQTPFVDPTDTFNLVLGIDNPPDDATLNFEVMHPITNDPEARNKLDSYAQGKGPNEPFQKLSAVPLADVPEDANANRVVPLQIVPLTGEVPLLGFRIADPGVYPVVVSLHGGNPSELLGRFTTYLIILPPPDPSAAAALQVAPIVMIRAPVAVDAAGATTIDAAELKRLRAITDATRNHPSVPMTVHANPETLNALDVAPGAVAPAVTSEDLAKAWKNSSVCATPFVPVDVTAWVNSLMTTDLDHQFKLGAATLDDRLHPTRGLDHRCWLASDGPSPEALAALRSLGHDHLVVPAEVVGPLDTTLFKPDALQIAAAQPFDLAIEGQPTVRAVVEETRLRDRLTATDNPALNAQLAIADLAVMYFGAQRPPSTPGTPFSGPRGVTFTLPETTTAQPSVAAFLTALERKVDPGGTGRSILNPVTLDSIFAIEPTTTKAGPPTRSYLPSNDPNRAMGDYRDHLRSSNELLAAYASMLPPAEQHRIGPLVQLVDTSGAAALTPPQRQAYLDVITKTVNATANGVELPRQERVTLAAAEADLHIQLENHNNFPIVVRIKLTNNKLAFPTGAVFDPVLQPGSNRVAVRVQARAAGDLGVRITLTSPDGYLDLTPPEADLPVRSTAVSGLGLALTIGAGIFLVIWWIRNFRKSRRADNLVPRVVPGAGSDNPQSPEDESGAEAAGQTAASESSPS